MQKTRLQKFETYLGRNLGGLLTGSWRKRSISIISLLLGFFIGSNVTVYFLEEIGKRALVVLILVFMIEILIRIRPRNTIKMVYFWISIDNLRIGITYALILEAFKLGS